LTGERGEHSAKKLEYTGLHSWQFRDGKFTRVESLRMSRSPWNFVTAVPV
jgi:hypothetical protein